jgi:glycosyltransferase involved in cell wall biosynthesis
MLTGGSAGTAVGGAQLQQILIGRELVRRGHDVTFVEYDDGDATDGTVDGIQVATKPRPAGSPPRRAHTAIRGTQRVLRDVDPDVCYRRVLNFEILPIAWCCSRRQSRFIYGIAHDDEMTDDPHMLARGLKHTRVYRAVNDVALSSAAAVIAQNGTQAELARERLATTVHTIPNCYPAATADPVDWAYDPPVVFWAARVVPIKRPDIVAELAHRLPEVTFVMAGGGDREGLYGDILAQSRSLPNLELLGHVPIAEIDRHFAAADLFLNTSDAEGFPNTFLQAWAQGTPVCSLPVDPDQILRRTGIGLVADGSMDRLEEVILKIAEDARYR